MRRVFVVLCLMLCSAAMFGQKTRFGQTPAPSTNPDDYTIKVHISGIHFRLWCTGDTRCDEEVIADAVMNGQKIELTGVLTSFHHDHQIRMLPGDYLAHFVKNEHKTGNTPLFQGFDILMPDKTVWQSTVTGISE